MTKNKNTVWFALFRSHTDTSSPVFVTKDMMSVRETQKRLQEENKSLFWLRSGRVTKNGEFVGM